MTATVAQTLAAVPTLNQTGEPFTFAVDGDRIVGRWDIVKATSLYPTEVDHVDKKYAITVTLDEGTGRYDFSETRTETTAHLDGGGLSFGTSGFKGKSSSKEFSFEFGGLNKTSRGGADDGISTRPVTYSFETSRIKEPLFAFLAQGGWEPAKKGLLARLFRH